MSRGNVRFKKVTDSRNLCASEQCMYSLKKGMGCVHLLFCSESTVVRRQGENAAVGQAPSVEGPAQGH